MPGTYNDDLIVEVKTKLSSAVIAHTVPLHMTVYGCPLFIENHVVGMTTVKSGDPEHLGMYVCIGVST